jgi:hypothetical protein
VVVRSNQLGWFLNALGEEELYSLNIEAAITMKLIHKKELTRVVLETKVQVKP